MKFYKHKSLEYFDGSFGELKEDYLLARNEEGGWASVSKSGKVKKFTKEQSKGFDNFIVAGGWWVDAGELITEEQKTIKEF
jgi:hypothetical protein